MVRKRYSSQKKQEQVSRKQLEVFLEKHEWITGDIEPDLGEDILVRIFRDGVSTGLSLYVQLKSVREITKHQLSTGDISYDFDTDDLGHWEVQTPMVILVIWDVTQSVGWWISINDAIKYLDRFNPTWRSNNTAAVRIPINNRVDEHGLENIQGMLAQLYGPVIGKDKEIVINAKFLFPQTPEGQEKFKALQRTMAAGDRIELEGQYIQEFSLPEWWTRIYGAPDPKAMILWIGSTPSDEILPLQIEFQSDGFQPERIPYVEFKRIKQGFEETTLSNAHQGISLQFDMVIKPGTGAFTLTFHSNYVDLEGKVALQLINIEKMYAQGGQIQIMALKTGQVMQFAIPPGSRPPLEPQFAQFVENLAAIQHITGRVLRIPDFASLTFGQMREAQELASIITTGRYVRTAKNFDIELLRPGVGQLLRELAQNGTLYVRIGYEMVNYDLFGEQFELGPCIRTIQGKLSNSYDELTTWYEQADDKDCYKIKLAMPEITDDYQNWLPAKNYSTIELR